MTYHQEFIIMMEGKFCDQVDSNLIDTGSKYIYLNPYVVDKCSLNK